MISLVSTWVIAASHQGPASYLFRNNEPLALHFPLHSILIIVEFGGTKIQRVEPLLITSQQLPSNLYMQLVWNEDNPPSQDKSFAI